MRLIFILSGAVTQEGKPESARKREENREGVMEPWVKYWLVQSRVKALQQQAYIIFSHMTQ